MPCHRAGMFIVFLSVFVPLGLFLFAPSFVRWLAGKSVRRDAVFFAALGAYFISWYIPSPTIDGMDTSFSTHFIGGGIFSGLVWLWAKRQLGWKPTWMLELLGVYAFVSALGVANELFELAAVQSGVLHITSVDTWWDLLANTLGAFVFWTGYRAARLFASKK